MNTQHLAYFAMDLYFYSRRYLSGDFLVNTFCDLTFTKIDSLYFLRKLVVIIIIYLHSRVSFPKITLHVYFVMHSSIHFINDYFNI